MAICILHSQGVAWRKHDETAAFFQKLHERDTVTGVERERTVHLASDLLPLASSTKYLKEDYYITIRKIIFDSLQIISK